MEFHFCITALLGRESQFGGWGRAKSFLGPPSQRKFPHWQNFFLRTPPLTILSSFLSFQKLFLLYPNSCYFFSLSSFTPAFPPSTHPAPSLYLTLHFSMLPLALLYKEGLPQPLPCSPRTPKQGRVRHWQTWMRKKITSLLSLAFNGNSAFPLNMKVGNKSQ